MLTRWRVNESFKRKIFATTTSESIRLVRLLVGAIFVSEGLQKFLYPAALGAGRFARIGIPFPDVLGPFVGTMEIISGALILAGLLVRPAASITLVIISVAIVTTKIPVLLGAPFLGFSLPKLESYGFWSMAHEGRADLSMWLCSLYLVIVGGGEGSIDSRIAARGARDHVGP